VGVLRKGGPSPRRDREANRALDHPLMPHLADRRDPMVARDLGTAYAPRRRATHRHPMLALATRRTALRDRPPLVGRPAAEHLVHETIRVAGIVARADVFAALPVIDKALFEDVPVLRRLCHEQIAPRQGMGCVGIERFSHVSRSASTPSSVFTGAPSPPPLSPLRHGDFRADGKCIFLYEQDTLSA